MHHLEASSLSFKQKPQPAAVAEEALAMPNENYNWFTEGFDTADLKDAKALLDELAA